MIIPRRDLNADISFFLQIPYLNINIRQNLIISQVIGMVIIVNQIYQSAKERDGYTIAVRMVKSVSVWAGFVCDYNVFDDEGVDRKSVV